MKIDSRRRITLPAEICKLASIAAGDEVKCFVDRSGVISLVKQSAGAAKGYLRGISQNKSCSEQESLELSTDK